MVIQMGISYQYKPVTVHTVGSRDFCTAFGIHTVIDVETVHWSCRITQPNPQYLKVVSSLQRYINFKINVLICALFLWIYIKLD